MSNSGWFVRCICGHSKFHHAGKVCMYCFCQNFQVEEEVVARPQLDHFVGREVESVGVLKEDGTWTIHLVGDVTIYSRKRVDKPKNLEGKILTTIMMDDKETRLAFMAMGTSDPQVMVSLDALKYEIETPDVEPFNPQKAQEQELGTGAFNDGEAEESVEASEEPSNEVEAPGKGQAYETLPGAGENE